MANNNNKSVNNMIHRCDHKGLEQLVRTMYGANRPFMIWGAPGIGKSETVLSMAKKIAKDSDLEFVEWSRITRAERNALAASVDNTGKFIYGDVRLSQYDPSDFAIPGYSDSGKEMEWFPSQLLKAYSVKGAAGILFMDELPQAIPAVQNAAYQIILDRGYKEASFQNIRMIAAGNRSADGGNQYAFAPALANRFSHVELLTPSGKEWVKWAQRNGVHPMVCAFISARDNMLYEQTGKTENRRFAWPSPRSWKTASDLLNTLPEYEPGIADSWLDTTGTLLSCSVGTGASMEFDAYVRVLHDVVLDKFLEEPDKFPEISVDCQLGVIAMLESRLTSVARKSTTKEKHKILKQAFALLDQKVRPEIWAMLIGATVRPFHPEGGTIRRNGYDIIMDILKEVGDKEGQKTMKKLEERLTDILYGN